MFELTISKQSLLTPLLMVAGAVDKKQSLPILSNILLRLSEQELHLSATDLDIEITACIPFTSSTGTGRITVPTKKMIDIVRSLDDDAIPMLSFDKDILSIKEGRSKFKVTTLSAENYPSSQKDAEEVTFSVPRLSLIYLFQSTHFAMSQQDVRFFLNGLLLELNQTSITAVGTDGHRMAISKLPCQLEFQHHRLLIPRKGTQEILRLLNIVNDEDIILCVSDRCFKITTKDYTFSTKLIEARFPPYVKAIPTNQDKHVLIERDVLKRALNRIIILANEKSRAILLHIQPGQLTLIANNQEQEEAIETVTAETQSDELKIGINANYLLDVINHMNEGMVRLSFANTDSSISVESLSDENYLYIIMPMKI